MNIRFGYPEVLLIFSGAMAFANMTLCYWALGLSILGAVCRIGLEQAEKQTAKEEISESVNTIAESIKGLLAGTGVKHDRTNLH